MVGREAHDLWKSVVGHEDGAIDEPSGNEGDTASDIDDAFTSIFLSTGGH